MKKLPVFLLFSALLFCPVLRAQNSDPGFARYRNTALSSTPSAVKVFTANLFGYTLINTNTSAVYVKFFNATVAGTTVGTTTPQAVIMVPPGDGTTPGVVYLSVDTVSTQFFQVACTLACVTGLADSSTTAPSAAIYVECLYR